MWREIRKQRVIVTPTYVRPFVIFYAVIPNHLYFFSNILLGVNGLNLYPNTYYVDLPNVITPVY